MTDDNDAVEAFRAELQELFHQVRRPTYRSLTGHAERAGLTLRTSTIGDLLNGPGTPRWETVEAFVHACARHARAHRVVPPAGLLDVDGWHARYRAMREAAEDPDGGPAPRTPTGRRGRRAPTVPAQLPADVAGFAGRREHLDQLDTLLSPSADPLPVVITAVSGTAGVGKTALAVQWAHTVAHHFPDGQLYVNLRGFDPGKQIMDPAEAIRGFLDALGVPPGRIPSELDAQAALYRSLIAEKHMLIVLDNARDAEQIRPLLPATGTSLALVTSRNPLTALIAAHGAHPVLLDVLSDGEARDVLARRIGDDRVDAEPHAVRAIITACARLPLALAIAAARAQQSRFGLAALAAELSDAGQRLDALDAGDPAFHIRTVFSWSYTTLSPPAARLFRLLGLHPGPDIDAAAAANLAGHPLPEVRRLLTELTRANLLTEHVAGRYTFHDLLRAYATELAHAGDTDQQRHAATTRLLDFYLHTAYAGDRLLAPSRDPIALGPPRPGFVPQRFTTDRDALQWFTAERLVLLAVAELAAASGFDAHAWQLVWAMDTFLYRQGHWHDWATAGGTAVAAAERLGDLDGRLRAHRLLGDAHIQLCQFEDAHRHLRHALDVGIAAGDRAGQGYAHLSLLWSWDCQEDSRQALDHAYQALDLFEAAGNLPGKGRAFSGIGWHHAKLGEYEPALAAAQRGLALYEELGDRSTQAFNWDTIGYIHHHLGHHAEAITCYQKARTMYHELGARYSEAESAAHLGDTYHAIGDRRAARDAWQHALDVLDELNHSDAADVRAKLDSLPETAP